MKVKLLTKEEQLGCIVEALEKRLPQLVQLVQSHTTQLLQLNVNHVDDVGRASHMTFQKQLRYCSYLLKYHPIKKSY